MWLAIGTGMTVLLLAAIGKQQKESCKDYSIVIKGVEGGQLFLEKQDVLKVLNTAMHGNIKGQTRKSFDLNKLEDLLEDNVWVKEARIYFDNHDVLHVSVQEREPLARIFTREGKSFYLDGDARLMQLSDKVSARLPVFTGFPDRKRQDLSDSSLKQEIIRTARYINGSPFWNSQVAQLDIVSAPPDGWEFEMVPLVGNHLIKLGDGNNVEAKFERLFTFYKEVLAKSGFDKYKTVDVRFAGQIVAARSQNPKVDQAQLRKSVETLLRQIKEAELKSDAEASKAMLVNTAPVKPAPLNTDMPEKEPVDETRQADSVMTKKTN